MDNNQENSELHKTLAAAVNILNDLIRRQRLSDEVKAQLEEASKLIRSAITSLE